jgi:hypothetical protein
MGTNNGLFSYYGDLFPNANGRPVGSGGGGTNQPTGGYAPYGDASPQLGNMVNQYASQNWLKQPSWSQPVNQLIGQTLTPLQMQPTSGADYTGAMTNAMNRLNTPLTMQTGLSDQERQGIYNQGRNQIQGAGNTTMEQMRTQLGNSGWVPGRSGIADSALGNIAMNTQNQLGTYAGNIATTEAQNRFANNMSLQGLNTQNALGANTIAGTLQGEAARNWGMQTDTAGLNLNRIGTGLTGMNSLANIMQGQQGTGMNLMNMMGGYENANKGYGLQGASIGNQANQWQQQFNYNQGQDALSNLYNWANLGQQSQQAQYNPYWQSMIGG